MLLDDVVVCSRVDESLMVRSSQEKLHRAPHQLVYDPMRLGDDSLNWQLVHQHRHGISDFIAALEWSRRAAHSTLLLHVAMPVQQGSHPLSTHDESNPPRAGHMRQPLD